MGLISQKETSLNFLQNQGLIFKLKEKREIMEMIVTTLENFDMQSKKLKNPGFIGKCIKTEVVQTQKITENQDIETNLLTVCTVVWDNQGVFYPACMAYVADQLVFLGSAEDQRLSEIEDAIGDLQESIEEIEEAIFEDDGENDDLSDDFES